MRASYFLNIRALLLFFISLILLACNGEKLSAIPAGSKILILGDSLTYGTGANAGQDYPTLLAQNTGWHVINAGVPGETSEEGLARLADLLKEHEPHLLMIELGGNDFLKKIPVTQTESSLRAIIQMAKEERIPTLLIAIPDYQPVKAALGGLSDHPLYKSLADETKVPLAVDVFSPVLSNNDLKSDYVHPNAVGYQAVEVALRESLIELGLLDNE